MPSYKVLNMEGKELETIELNDDIFNHCLLYTSDAADEL